MPSESTMAVIEAAVQSIEYCPCGNGLDIVSHGGGLWLECRTYANPSRLPGWLAVALRDLVHERRFVVDDPGTVEAAEATTRPVGASRPAARGA
jgi:hypothetical protein